MTQSLRSTEKFGWAASTVRPPANVQPRALKKAADESDSHSNAQVATANKIAVGTTTLSRIRYNPYERQRITTAYFNEHDEELRRTPAHEGLAGLLNSFFTPLLERGIQSSNRRGWAHASSSINKPYSERRYRPGSAAQRISGSLPNQSSQEYPTIHWPRSPTTHLPGRKRCSSRGRKRSPA